MQLCRRLLLEELQLLGIISSSGTVSAQFAVLSRVFPHAIGHYLGMDVHDTDLISSAVPFVNGMVVTVEPGIYVPDTDEFPARYAPFLSPSFASPRLSPSKCGERVCICACLRERHPIVCQFHSLLICCPESTQVPWHWHSH